MPSDPKVSDTAYREAAREKLLFTYNIDQSSVEIDESDDSVSRNKDGDNGAFVKVWLWVENPEPDEDD